MITRIILVSVPKERAAEAERMWKQECAPLMIKQPGCLSEQFLRGRENPGEFISVSTWKTRPPSTSIGPVKLTKPFNNTPAH